ncbi:cellobiose phosphorylase [Yokenella regensburgei]|nr:cellobiose phosphorylase [Yokenella regensburgei]
MDFARQGNIERAWELKSMINPINHSLSAEAVNRYKTEHYAMSADIYSKDPHSGRGGWSWYTGSAGWTYRLITEALLGITRQGEAISIHCHLPAAWSEITLSYQQRSCNYGTVAKLVMRRPFVIERSYISNTLLTRRISPRGSP